MFWVWSVRPDSQPGLDGVAYELCGEWDQFRCFVFIWVSLDFLLTFPCRGLAFSTTRPADLLYYPCLDCNWILFCSDSDRLLYHAAARAPESGTIGRAIIGATPPGLPVAG